MQEYTTVDGETLSGIIFRYYGKVNENLLEQVFNMNPNLSRYSLVLPQGVIIILPEITNSPEIQPIPLWE